MEKGSISQKLTANEARVALVAAFAGTLALANVEPVVAAEPTPVVRNINLQTTSDINLLLQDAAQKRAELAEYQRASASARGSRLEEGQEQFDPHHDGRAHNPVTTPRDMINGLSDVLRSLGDGLIHNLDIILPTVLVVFSTRLFRYSRRAWVWWRQPIVGRPNAGRQPNP